jgi:hypothetical protein
MPQSIKQENVLLSEGFNSATKAASRPLVLPPVNILKPLQLVMYQTKANEAL